MKLKNDFLSIVFEYGNNKQTARFLLPDINQSGVGKNPRCLASRFFTITGWFISGNKNRDVSWIFLF